MSETKATHVRFGFGEFWCTHTPLRELAQRLRFQEVTPELTSVLFIALLSLFQQLKLRKL